MNPLDGYAAKSIDLVRDNRLRNDYWRYMRTAERVWYEALGKEKDTFEEGFMKQMVEEQVDIDMSRWATARARTLSAECWVYRLMETVWTLIGKSSCPLIPYDRPC